MQHRVGFARWRSDLPSGGNRYDAELAAALPALGVDLREYDVAGRWPVPDAGDRERLTQLLTAEPSWLIGNIVASAAPDAVRAAVAAGRRVTVLVHYFPADDIALARPERERLAGSEQQALAAASAVVVTSGWAARELASRYGRGDAVVALPGVAPAPPAPGSARDGEPPALLWLGRMSRGKDPLTFVEALTRLADLDWTARLVGPDTEPDLGREVAERIESAGLTGRVAVVGPRVGEELEHAWAATDLLVHTSRSETYGMVVSEAAARGIPSVVASGTGAVEAQQSGVTFPGGDAKALEAELRRWLSDPALRDRWRADAAARRTQLPTWRETARAVASALAGW